MLAPAVLALALLQGAPQEGPFVQVLAPGTEYDPAVPTLEEVVGHDFHEEITPPDGINAYLRALAAAAPERTELVEYARSWEGRPLLALVIGAAERMARLDAVTADLRRLAEPDRVGPGELERLVAELPVVTALLHGVHGNEISSAGAAMAEAYHLLAARNDPEADDILRESLVIVDPAQNPDGRARFVAHYATSRAHPPDPDPSGAGHDEPWPGGRTNHYLFDLNRDWFAQTQPESRGRTALLLEYQPHVVVDLHEMGGDATYYFPPAARPGNPWTTPTQEERYLLFGRANADRFDQRGFTYFTREIYDAFYPGYGVSWPTAHGALGMTFEQASARGLVYRRSDGSLLTYGDGILHHFTAALSTAATAARNREGLLRDFAAFRRGGVEAGRTGEVRAYVLHSEHDPALAARLARLLTANGIRVERAEEPVTVAGRRFPPEETWVVPLDQPAHALIRNLLDPTTPMDPEFVERQVERRAERLPDEIYDVTAWSLPLLWDVEAVPASGPAGVRTTPVEADAAGATGPEVPEARVAWLIPWNTAGAAAVAQALREDLLVRSAGGAFTLAGRDFPVGTGIIRTSDHRDRGLAGHLSEIAGAHGAEVVAVDESFVDRGMSLGSGRVRALRKPSVLLLWDEPTSAYSAGWARFVLERRYGVPVTAVRAESLSRVVLGEHDVIVLPDGRYVSELDDGTIRDLREWMGNGGTLVTMAESSRWAARVGLLATTTELRGGAPDLGEDRPEPSRAAPEQPVDLLEAIVPPLEPPVQTPGAILNVDLDTGHWLSAGTDGRIGALVDGRRVFTPITLDRGTNVGVYAPLGELVAGGIVWEEARPQLANKAFLVHQPVGRGQLIAFAEDPNYRAYAEASGLLFLNAVLLGPGR